MKNPEAFSKNKLLNLKQEIHRLNIKGRTLNPTLSGVVPCEDCTPKQKDEIQCAGCDKWKGRDAFSNQQRKNDDPVSVLPVPVLPFAMRLLFPTPVLNSA